MIGCITQEARDRQNAAIVKASGPLATMSEYRDYQGPLASAPGVTLTSSTAGAPLASTFHDHAAGMTVDVQRAGYQEAADRGHALTQMGQRRPSGDPSALGPERVAPTGVGAQFRQNMPQAASRAGATYMPGTIGGSY